MKAFNKYSYTKKPDTEVTYVITPDSSRGVKYIDQDLYEIVETEQEQREGDMSAEISSIKTPDLDFDELMLLAELSDDKELADKVAELVVFSKDAKSVIDSLSLKAGLAEQQLKTEKEKHDKATASWDSVRSRQRQRIADHQDRIDELETAIRSMEKLTTAVNDPVDLAIAYDTLSDKYHDIKAELEFANDDIDAYGQEVHELKDANAALQDRVDELEEQLSKGDIV